MNKRRGRHVGLVGLDNLGTAIGNLAANNGHDVIGWEYHESVAKDINEKHANDRFLSGVELHPSLTATGHL